MRTGYKEFKEKCTHTLGAYFIAYLWATHREEEWKTFNGSAFPFTKWIEQKHKSFCRKHPKLIPVGETYDEMFQEWLDNRCVQERRTK